jgi:hypothetical protein
VPLQLRPDLVAEQEGPALWDAALIADALGALPTAERMARLRRVANAIVELRQATQAVGLNPDRWPASYLPREDQLLLFIARTGRLLDRPTWLDTVR